MLCMEHWKHCVSSCVPALILVAIVRIVAFYSGRRRWRAIGGSLRLSSNREPGREAGNSPRRLDLQCTLCAATCSSAMGLPLSYAGSDAGRR
jgi:hypothetical protein